MTQLSNPLWRRWHQRQRQKDFLAGVKTFGCLECGKVSAFGPGSLSFSIHFLEMARRRIMCFSSYSACKTSAKKRTIHCTRSLWWDNACVIWKTASKYQFHFISIQNAVTDFSNYISHHYKMAGTGTRTMRMPRTERTSSVGNGMYALLQRILDLYKHPSGCILELSSLRDEYFVWMIRTAKGAHESKTSTLQSPPAADAANLNCSNSE